MRTAGRWLGGVMVAGVVVSIARRRIRSTAPMGGSGGLRTIPHGELQNEASVVSARVDETVADVALKDIQAQTRSQLKALALSTAFVLLGVLLAAWVYALPPSTRIDVQLTDVGTWVPVAWAAVGGRLSSAQLLMLNLGLLALCATLTVALAIGRGTPRTTRDQVASNIWRARLHGAAGVAALAAVVSAIISWAGPVSRESSGASIATGVIAALAVLLVTAIQQEENTASYLRAIRDCRARLETVEARRRLIHLTAHGAADSTTASDGSKTTGFALRIALRAIVIGALVVVAAVAAGKATAALTGERFDLTARVLFVGLPLLSLIATAGVLAIGRHTVQVWSQTYRVWRWRQRRWTSIALRLLTILFLSAFAIASGQGRLTGTIVLGVYLLGVVLVTWTLIWLARLEQRPRGLAMVARPVWQLVLNNLERAERSTLRELDEAEAALQTFTS